MFQGQEQKRPLDLGRPKALSTDSERGDLPRSPPPRRPPASGLPKHSQGCSGLSLSLSPRRAQGEVISTKYTELLASPNVHHFLRCVASGGEACLDDEGVVEGEGQSGPFVIRYPVYNSKIAPFLAASLELSGIEWELVGGGD